MYFVVCATVTEPTSSFIDVWPSAVISETLKDLNVEVSAPELDFTSSDGRDIKYSVQKDYDALYAYWYEYIKEYGEWIFNIDPNDEEAIKGATEATIKELLGVFVNISDPDFEYYDAYYEKLTDAGWHKEINEYDQVAFEDPSGSLAIYLSCANYITNINFCMGSGKTHNPSLKFANSDITLGVGSVSPIALNLDMIVGEVTFSSDDNGENITIEGDSIYIKNDATVGDVVTVTATGKDVNGNTYTDTLKITIAGRTPYNTESAAGSVANAFNAYKGLEGENAIDATYDDYGDCYGFEVNLTDSVTVEEIKKLVTDSLIPEGFVASSDWEETTNKYGDVISTIKYSCDDVEIVYKVTYTDGTILLYAYAFNVKSESK